MGNGSHGPTNGISSYIDGSVNHTNYFYAIGLYKQWLGGIPASQIIAGTGVKKVELWVQ